MKTALFFALVFSTVILSQAKLVTFRVAAPELEPGQKIYIAGNQPILGNWDPGTTKLDSTAPGIFQKSFTFRQGIVVEFKFTRGSWDTEALMAKGQVPDNFSLRVENDTLLAFSFSSWRDKDTELANTETKFSGQVTGKVRYHLNLSYPGIRNRTVAVWLPPGYDASEDRYPVLYMHDGQSCFDPLTSSFGRDWEADECADRMIRSGEIKPIIIAAIFNSPARGIEYADNDTGRAYMDFIVKYLKPLIDSAYRTKPDRGNTAVAGSSLGGLAAFMLAWEHDSVFSKAGCFSPAFKIDIYDYVSSVKKYTGSRKDIKFYIDNGGVGLEADLQPGVDAMLASLKGIGFRMGSDIYYIKDNEAIHSEAAWASRFHYMLDFFFK